MLIYAVDLGTTNVKVVLFDAQLRRLAVSSAPSRYVTSGVRVEFSASALFDLVVDQMWECARTQDDLAGHPAVVVLTGQAESLVINDRAGEPVRPAMSWLDDRATAEAAHIGEVFGVDEAFAVTGQPTPSATWPAMKLRWLASHEPRSVERAASVLMIKDEIARRLTGTCVGEVTTRGFTYLYDVRAGCYWRDMLDVVGVPEETLPPVVQAGVDLGPVLDHVAEQLPPASSYRVNVGALDHFCAMVGTGSYLPDVVSESAGTVLSLSMLTAGWSFDPSRKVSFHAGLRPDEIVLFNGVDSGGVSLEWFRREALGGMRYDDLESALVRRGDGARGPIFLPYLTGVNPPDFFTHARGAFLEIDLGHTSTDLAYAVEEGVAHLLRRNVEYLSPSGTGCVVSTGGGASSPFWNQLKADVCGIDVLVPDEREATCRGAAALALVAAGLIGDVADATSLAAPETRTYSPSPGHHRDERYRRFETYLERLFVTTEGDRR
ncbi:FGGY-family carbohydrate kinase [Janibacter melonis]|uniref:FGGY-family carbohydrate kinase n=1 Tax=Janibacter melonis TaxID=262209 RepID=UPI001E6440A8|nr:FGGY family carbohydrate kinase [Janibacter melonis]MCB5991184.1 hypothetical protein [Janibacter melonis]